MNIRWDVRALEDLRDIRRYIAKGGSPTTADRVRDHLHTRIALLLTRPLIGVLTTNPDIRILPPTRYPYRIYYTIHGEDVVILHVRHSARAEPDDVSV
jgi:plasmid stabilization system protein ParE